MMDKLGDLQSKVISSFAYDPQLVEKELAGGPLTAVNAGEDVERLINGLEKLL